MIPGFLFSLIGFALLVGPLVFLHELGHYLAGRACGVKADAFSIGFGPEIAGWTDRRGTRWKLSAFPLGGYVRFAGDMNPASVPDAAWLSLPPEERARTFQAKKLWQRAVIVAAGPFANFVVAAVVLAILATQTGLPIGPAVIGTVEQGSAAAVARLEPGDRIVRAGGESVSNFADLILAVRPHPGAALPLAVERKGDVIDLTVRPGAEAAGEVDGHVVKLGVLGVTPAPAGPIDAVRIGVVGTGQIIVAVAQGVGQLVIGHASWNEVGGPVRIASVSGQQFQAGWVPFMMLLALYSVNLGFINLLPVPVLDGGHLFFYAVEAVRRRPLGPKAMEWAFGSGLVAILTLMLVVTAHDLGAFDLWKHFAGLIG